MGVAPVLVLSLAASAAGHVSTRAVLRPSLASHGRLFSSTRLPAPAVRRPLRSAPGPQATVSLPALAAATLTPPLLGLAKREYTVSYGYGLAMFAAGALSLYGQRPWAFSTPAVALPAAHAAVYALYGARLVLFLLYRELNIPFFREMRERVEQRAPAGARAKRLPFCLSCGVLYLCMAAPLAVTATAAAAKKAAPVLTGLVTLAYAGWLVAALGDLQKTLAKAAGAKLVTTGLYRRLRHPNYTGEAFLWGASAAVSLVAAAVKPSLATAGWVALSGLGCAGIQFVLAMATGGLERRQAEKYGDLPEYKGWIKGSWSGPMLGGKPTGSKAKKPKEAGSSGDDEEEDGEDAMLEEAGEGEGDLVADLAQDDMDELMADSFESDDSDD